MYIYIYRLCFVGRRDGNARNARRDREDLPFCFLLLFLLVPRRRYFLAAQANIHEGSHEERRLHESFRDFPISRSGGGFSETRARRRGANDQDDRSVCNEKSVMIDEHRFPVPVSPLSPIPETKKRKKLSRKKSGRGRPLLRGAARYLAVYGYQKDIWLLVILVILSPCKCCIYIFTLFIIIREHGNK